MRFALLSADKSHCVRFKINPWEGDATSFMNWLDVWQGYHFNFTKTLENPDILKDFDVVMMSGHPSHIVDIIKIAEYLKDTDAISMFYPEGSCQLYGNSINGFQPLYFDSWRACDIVSCAEEDKVSYYKSFVTSETHVAFIHVPMRKEMSDGFFFRPRSSKMNNMAVVYGDNNPNHPLNAIACCAQLGLDVILVDVDRDGKLEAIQKLFPSTRFKVASKLGLFHYLNLLSTSILHFYPTEWIGTARENIACAITGTPCIGASGSHTQRRLYPDWMSFSPYDIEGMKSAAKKLLSNETEYERVAVQAFELSRFYGLESTKLRFMAAVTRARDIKNRRKVAVA